MHHIITQKENIIDLVTLFISEQKFSKYKHDLDGETCIAILLNFLKDCGRKQNILKLALAYEGEKIIGYILNYEGTLAVYFADPLYFKQLDELAKNLGD